MATVKEAVKESLLGTTVEPQLSQQARANFEKHARRGDNGELFMSEDDFINAIAPESENYVRPHLPLRSVGFHLQGGTLNSR